MRSRAHPMWRAVLAVVLLSLAGCAGGPPAVAPPPSTPSPAPLTEGAPAGPEVLWNGDLETGDLSQFQDTPWNNVGGTGPEVVRDVVRQGDFAVRLGIAGPTTSEDGICCGSRDEIEPQFRELVTGDDLYFTFSTYLAPGFPTEAAWQVIVQFKQNFDGSPPLSMTVEEGQYRLDGGYGHPDGPKPFVVPLATATTGVWVDWVMHVRFSRDPLVGFVEVWKDGRQVLARYSPQSGTLYPGPNGYDASELKLGYYRENIITQPGDIYFDDISIRSRMDVSALANAARHAR